jgi:hypothetical protein
VSVVRFGLTSVEEDACIVLFKCIDESRESRGRDGEERDATISGINGDIECGTRL